MLTSGFDPDLKPTSVVVDDQVIRVTFSGGLELATPVSRFPRLQCASPEQRREWRLIGRGDGIHWPVIDEDISIAGLFRGARKPASSIEEIPRLISDLYQTTQHLNRLFPGRPFTPDGHLVGSIGEVVAEFIYDLVLEPCSTPGIDARTRDESKRSVQIKLTGQTGTAYGLSWSSGPQAVIPDLLLCLKLTDSGFVEIYNGPFPLDLLQAKKDQKNGQVSLSVTVLKQLNPSSLRAVRNFDEINRWFSDSRPQVA